MIAEMTKKNRGILLTGAIVYLAFCLFAVDVEASNKNKNSNNLNSNQTVANGNVNSNVNSNTNTNANVNANNNTNSSSGEGINGAREEEVEANLQKKREDLSQIEAKIKTYSKLVDIKRNEQRTLNNQIEIIDNQIEKTKNEVQEAEKNLEITSAEIEKLELEIDDKIALLKKKKEALSLLVNDLYRKDKKSILEILLDYKGFSFFVQEFASNQQANQSVFNKLKEISTAKQELEERQEKVKKKNDELESTRQKKMEKTFYLEGEQNSKENLLVDTAGEESKYQEILARVEEEKKTLLGDIDELYQSKSSEFDFAQSNQARPTSGLASTDWYFSQKDPRWGSDDIGYSNTKMSKYGCAVSCVAMVLRYHGVSMDPGLLARQPIFSRDLIVWPGVWQHVKRVSSYSHGNLDWDVVDQEIENRNPVIIFVRANGRGAGHYVVVHHKDNNGKYVVHDPMWGPNIFLASTKENIGILYGSSTSSDQMIIYHNTKRSGEPLSTTEGATPAPAAESSNKNSNTNSKP